MHCSSGLVESFFGVLNRDINTTDPEDTRIEVTVLIQDYIVNVHNPLRRADLLRTHNERLSKENRRE